MFLKVLWKDEQAVPIDLENTYIFSLLHVWILSAGQCWLYFIICCAYKSLATSGTIKMAISSSKKVSCYQFILVLFFALELSCIWSEVASGINDLNLRTWIQMIIFGRIQTHHNDWKNNSKSLLSNLKSFNNLKLSKQVQWFANMDFVILCSKFLPLNWHNLKGKCDVFSSFLP